MTGDVFFTRDGILLPVIKSKQVWGDENPDLLYPVVSFRGKLTTIKVNLGQQPFLFKD